MLLDKTIAVIAMGVAAFTVFYVAADHDIYRLGFPPYRAKSAPCLISVLLFSAPCGEGPPIPSCFHKERYGHIYMTYNSIEELRFQEKVFSRVGQCARRTVANDPRSKVSFLLTWRLELRVFERAIQALWVLTNGDHALVTDEFLDRVCEKQLTAIIDESLEPSVECVLQDQTGRFSL